MGGIERRMNYDDVNKEIMISFPAFSVDDDDLELPYIVAGRFTDYLLTAYQTGDKETYNRGLQFIERLQTDDSEKVRELATVGYLESIQNTWPKDFLEAEIPFNDLGEQSKIWWMKLNNFWNGRVKFLT
jgi:hypothetical protein